MARRRWNRALAATVTTALMLVAAACGGGGGGGDGSAAISCTPAGSNEKVTITYAGPERHLKLVEHARDAAGAEP